MAGSEKLLQNSVIVNLYLDPIAINRYLTPQRVSLITLWVERALWLFCLIALSYTLYSSVSTVLGTKTLILDRAGSVPIEQGSSERGRRTKPSVEIISSRNIFGPLTARDSGRQDTPKVAKPPLSLALIGTFLSQGGLYAIIEDTKKTEQDVFSSGDSVFGEASVMEVLSEKVTLKRDDGEIITLILDDSASSSSAGSSAPSVESMVVNKAELDEALSNLPLLLTQARAVPYFKDGKSVGLRLFAIKSGSMFETIGLKNGDILKSINGTSLADITQAVKLFEELRNERSIAVQVERNREDKEFQYQIR